MSRQNFNDKSRPPPDHQKALVKLIDGMAYRHDKWQVFSDFVEMGAISISNAVDLVQRDQREERYRQIVQRYKPDELTQFPQMLGELVMALESETLDVLGKTFHDLELHNKWTGQFFSPYPVCRMMAKMTLGDKADIEARIAERGFICAAEPAAGSGAMVLALAQEMREQGVNYQKHLHVTAVDVDPKCVHMAYLQLSLLHIPAVVVHGNSLSLEEWGHWHTPAHILDGWDGKLRRKPDSPALVETFQQAAPPELAEPIIETPAKPKQRPAEPPSQLTLF